VLGKSGKMCDENKIVGNSGVQLPCIGLLTFPLTSIVYPISVDWATHCFLISDPLQIRALIEIHFRIVVFLILEILKSPGGFFKPGGGCPPLVQKINSLFIFSHSLSYIFASLHS